MIVFLGYVFTPTEVALIDTFSTHLYNERFSEVRGFLTRTKDRTDPLLYKVLKLAYLQLYMSDNNTDYGYDEFVSLLNDITSKYSSRTLKLRDKLLLATTYAMGSIFFGRRKDMPKALSLGRKAFDLYKEAYDEDSTIYDALLPMGLYDYAIGYLTRSPERKRKGIERLKKVAKRGTLAKPLAYIGLLYVHIFDNKPGKAVEYGLKALSMYPRSRTFRWILAQAYMKAAMYPEARKTYLHIKEDIRRRNPECKICIAEALYYVGETYRKEGNEKKAREVWYNALWYLNAEKDQYRQKKVEELRRKLKRLGIQKRKG
ncbi:MAG: hypothetical protein GXO39_01935 [Thermotogae bacterium]|nr:hypothetical protein [Thermotogota bacterium]